MHAATFGRVETGLLGSGQGALDERVRYLEALRKIAVRPRGIVGGDQPAEHIDIRRLQHGRAVYQVSIHDTDYPQLMSQSRTAFLL
jgi:hypothetical protein